jgi:hypothetical protein
MTPLVPLILMTTVFGQAAAPKLDEKQLVRILEPYFQEQAENYEFFLDPTRKQKLLLVKKPIMRWTAEGNLGAVWVWAWGERAELVGCLGAFVNGQGKLEAFHEFHSLTLRPLQRVEIQRVRTWESKKPGALQVLLKDAPAPAPTDKRRLVQMREIARQFTAHQRVDGKTELLRMSSTPLFRQAHSNGSVIDGALFSYLRDTGTDPDLILFIEAVNGADGPQWVYSPVRFSWREVWLNHLDKEVWRGAEHNEFWTSQTLHDNYVTCVMGLLDIEAIQAGQKDNP